MGLAGVLLRPWAELARFVLRLADDDGSGASEPSPSRARPRAVPDVLELAARMDDLDDQVAQLAALPKEWQEAVRDLEDLLERMELKRNRLAATESRLRRQQQAQETTSEAIEADGGSYPSLLAESKANARKAGLLS